MRLLMVLVCAGCMHAATLRVGTARADSQQRATGYIQVPAGVDAAASVPVIVINGAKPGPTLALVGGAHGTEYASIVALEKLADEIPVTVSGAVVILPLLNTASFAQKVPHLNPVDGKNMNRFYPGKADGTQTERISWAVSQQVLAKADYLIDYHGGDLDENMRSYAYWAQTGKSDLDAASRAMVLAFGLDHIILQDFRVPGPSVTITRYAAATLGKPSLAVEAGHAGTLLAQDVEALVSGTLSVMRHLKMLPGEPHPVAHPLWFPRYSSVTSEADGIFYPLAAPEAYVTQGMTIGYVTDYFGKRLWDAVAPSNGVILYIGAVPSMKKGDTVANIGEVQ